MTPRSILASFFNVSCVGTNLSVKSLNFSDIITKVSLTLWPLGKNCPIAEATTEINPLIGANKFFIPWAIFV